MLEVYQLDCLINVILDLLQQDLQANNDFALHCLRSAPSAGVVATACTQHHWFCPNSKHRCCCQLPVSGMHMQRVLQFRLGLQQLAIVTGRFSGGQNVPRVDRICSHCPGTLADYLQVIYECPLLQPLRLYADLFGSPFLVKRIIGRF